MERLLDYFIPQNYNLSLSINKATGKASGTVVISGTPQAKSPEPSIIKLHAVGLKIASVELNGQRVVYAIEDDVLVIPMDDASSLGPFSRRSARPEAKKKSFATSLTITYTFTLNRNMQGAYLSTYEHEGKEERIVSTQFESHYARECFPCVDEPAAKATFDLKITSADPTDTIISNMPIKSEKIVAQKSASLKTVGQKSAQRPTDSRNTAQQKTVTFETTPKMSTYLLAFCLGHFHKRSKTNEHGVKVTTYCALNQDPKTLDFANDIAADSLDYYNRAFKIRYPLPKLDQVAIPDFEAGAMENWGLVTYRESCLLAAPDESKTTKEYISTVIAHELSHQWFGNLVTMSWWDNLWLNESFANVMEYICIDNIRPRYHIWEYFFTGDCRIALLRDALPGVQAVEQAVNDPAEIATLFDGAIVYAKGSHLMFMLLRLMGEKNFMKGLADYFKKHKYSNTTGDDLWAALQPYADFDVKSFMDAWITQPGYPVITDGHQQRFLLTGGTDKTKWPLPEITDDMSGHYIINLSADEFAAQLKNFSKLSLEQKIRLLLDRSLLAKTSLVSSATHLDLLPKFKSEKNFAIWSPVVALINDLKLFFSPKDPDFPEFQRYVFDLVSKQLPRLGLQPSPREDDNDSKLRQIMIGLALYAEDKKTANALASLYSDDFNKIHPDLRSAVFAAKIRLEDEANSGSAKSEAKSAKSETKSEAKSSPVFDYFLKSYQKTADPNIKDDLLSALTDSKTHTTKLLHLLDQHDVVRPQDHLYLFVDLLRNYKTREKAIDWLYENWDAVVEMTGEKSVEDYPRLLAGALRTTEEAKKFDEFFAPLAKNPVLTRTIAVAQADISARLRLISMDYDDVHKHLSSLL